MANSHSQLLPRVREALKAVAAGLSTHGMKVNDSAGKTEIMISFHGPGSMAAAEAVHSQALPTIKVNGPLFIHLKCKSSTSTNILAPTIMSVMADTSCKAVSVQARLGALSSHLRK